MSTRNEKQSLLKYLFWGLCLVTLFYVDTSLAASAGGDSIKTVADNVKSTFASIAELITSASYIAGMGFGVGAIMKFKAHKDNPTQIPIGTPIALLFISAALLFMPSIFQVAGGTLFGSSASAGGISGTTTF